MTVISNYDHMGFSETGEKAKLSKIYSVINTLLCYTVILYRLQTLCTYTNPSGNLTTVSLKRSR